MSRRDWIAIVSTVAACAAGACGAESSVGGGGEPPADARDVHDANDVHDAGDVHDAAAADAIPDAPAAVPPDAAPLAGDLRFAVVGDTRPANLDDTAHYPTAIIQQIWSDVEAASPHPSFALSTGDYMFASTGGVEADAQLDLYLGARAAYQGTVYPALGNHECTGYTASNCGSGAADGITRNYSAFIARMLMPLGHAQPWYEVDVAPAGAGWTAKLVFVAANAWSSEQAGWLEQALARPTTYTFVIRHEGVDATTAPGVTPSQQIIDQHPLTLLIVGHTHTYRHQASAREVICGNGGAPLTSGANYGYAIVDRRGDGAIQLTAYDYASNAVVDRWAVHADGTPAP
jgi:Calcineurin-like phosphoesterase